MSSPSRKPQVQKLLCTVAGAHPERDGVRVVYAPVRGHPPEVEDSIAFRPREDVAVVQGVGRFLRLLRAARLRPPGDPYALSNDVAHAVALVERARGTHLEVQMRRRFDKVLSIWTDVGHERITGILDVEEEIDALAVRRRGGQSTLRIPRASLIRYEANAHEYLEVISVDVPQQMQLP